MLPEKPITYNTSPLREEGEDEAELFAPEAQVSVGIERDYVIPSTSKTDKRLRGGIETEFFKPRPRGDESGPLRTPQHIADHWQAEKSYEVEEVR